VLFFLDMSTPQGPELHLDLSEASAAVRRVYTQGPELHLDLARQQGVCAAPGRVYSLHYIHGRELHRRIYTTVACAAPELVCNTEACAAPGHI
jgi:hypothetical protein